MAHKKSKGDKRSAKVQKRSRNKRERAEKRFVSKPIELPDRRAIEGAMWRQFNDLTAENNPALARAQNMMYDAFDTVDPDERVRIARDALAVSPDCADAYVVLGEEAESLAKAIEFYEQGVAAGRRALGEEFDATAGHFWGVLATRPYMRAREQLAGCLWAAGRRDESIEHYREMLRLNPGDNQGVRYVLVSRLIETGRVTELGELFKQFDEDSTHWLYSKALRAFQEKGDTAAARGFLKRAVKANRHVPVYVTGQRRMPNESPPSYEWGGEDEAVLYASMASGAWKSVPGAIGWLRKVADLGLSDPDEAAPQYSNTQLKKLPLTADECWRVIARELPDSPNRQDSEPIWTVALFSSIENDFVGTEMFESEPDVSDVWNVVTSSMMEPIVGNPRRPEVVEFLDEALLEQLGQRLRQLGIEVGVPNDADGLNEAFAQVTKQFATVRDPGAQGLDELPQEPEEDWQVDCRQMGVWVPDDDGNTVRPWVVLVTSPSRDVIVGSEIKTDQPSLELIGEIIERAMRQPMSGEPRRPGCVQVRSGDQRLAIQRRLEVSGVACESTNSLDHWDDIYDGLARNMEGQRKLAPLSELSGVEPAQLGSFFEAAADYYRAAPWHRTPVDVAFELTCDVSPKSWDAVVMGQNGQLLGLAMYEEGRGLRGTLDNPDDPEAAMADASALSLTFGEQHEMAAADLDAAEQFGWPVVAPEAFPIVFRVKPGNELTVPTAVELRVLEAAVRAVAKCVAAGKSKWTADVSLSSGPVRVSLVRKKLGSIGVGRTD